MLNKYTAGILAIILGGFGVHRFYLGQRFFGVVRFGAFVFFLIALINTYGPAEDTLGVMMGMLFLTAFIEGLIFMVMPKERFDKKYNKHVTQVSAPANVNELKAEGVDYFRSGDYDLAIEAFLDALDVRADDPGVHFNLACSFSQLRKLPLALRHLELSLSYGLPDPERIERHPALEWLRGQPAYAAFRKNNYRQQNLNGDGAGDHLAATPPAMEVLDLTDISEATVPAAAPSKSPDLLQQLQALGKLRERGILTPEEFAKQKEKLLTK